MVKPEKSKIKVALFGHGSFAEPAFSELEKRYSISNQDEAELLVVANYGKILSADEIKRPRFGAINLHGSILPKYRGASPIQMAIANNEPETGVSIILMDEKIDHGPILGISRTQINPEETTSHLKKRLGQLASELIIEILPRYLNGSLKPTEQDQDQASFTSKITLEEARISPDDSDLVKYNKVRAFGEEPGVFVKTAIGDLKIISAELIDHHFIPEIVQRPGKKTQTYTEFLNGYRHEPPFPLLSVDKTA